MCTRPRHNQKRILESNGVAMGWAEWAKARAPECTGPDFQQFKKNNFSVTAKIRTNTRMVHCKL